MGGHRDRRPGSGDCLSQVRAKRLEDAIEVEDLEDELRVMDIAEIVEERAAWERDFFGQQVQPKNERGRALAEPRPLAR